jgi:hypothetical protein
MAHRGARRAVTEGYARSVVVAGLRGKKKTERYRYFNTNPNRSMYLEICPTLAKWSSKKPSLSVLRFGLQT